MHEIDNHLITAADEDVISSILGGNTSCFEILIRKYNPALYKIARGYGFNHQDCEDLMQDAYVSAYTHLPQFENRSSFKTWISRILINKCIYRLNYGHTSREISFNGGIEESAKPIHMTEKSNFSEQSLARKEFSKIIEQVLEEIPVHYRTVFILREIEGFSVSETAELLNISTVNVKVRTNRSKAILQNKIEQYYSTADIYELNCIYCDRIVQGTLEKIGKGENGKHER